MDDKELTQVFERVFKENAEARAQLTDLIRTHRLPSNLNVPASPYARTLYSHMGLTSLSAHGALVAIKELSNNTIEVMKRIRMGQRSILLSRTLLDQKFTYDSKTEALDVNSRVEEHMKLYDMMSKFLSGEIKIADQTLRADNADA